MYIATFGYLRTFCVMLGSARRFPCKIPRLGFSLDRPQCGIPVAQTMSLLIQKLMIFAWEKKVCPSPNQSMARWRKHERERVHWFELFYPMVRMNTCMCMYVFVSSDAKNKRKFLSHVALFEKKRMSKNYPMKSKRKWFKIVIWVLFPSCGESKRACAYFRKKKRFFFFWKPCCVYSLQMLKTQNFNLISLKVRYVQLGICRIFLLLAESLLWLDILQIIFHKNCGCLMASGVGMVDHFWLFRATNIFRQNVFQTQSCSVPHIWGCLTSVSCLHSTTNSNRPPSPQKNLVLVQIFDKQANFSFQGNTKKLKTQRARVKMGKVRSHHESRHKISPEDQDWRSAIQP